MIQSNLVYEICDAFQYDCRHYRTMAKLYYICCCLETILPLGVWLVIAFALSNTCLLKTCSMEILHLGFDKSKDYLIVPARRSASYRDSAQPSQRCPEPDVELPQLFEADICVIILVIVKKNMISCNNQQVTTIKNDVLWQRTVRSSIVLRMSSK